MRASHFASALMIAAFVTLAAPASAQVGGPANASTPVQVVTSPLTPISATAAVNNQVTLTIPAPVNPTLYNYVCFLSYVASQDGTATAAVNSVTTSTNFNSFALKYSLAATADAMYVEGFNWGTPATGCVKSVSPGTATTFVSPSAAANTAFTWKATYYQDR